VDPLALERLRAALAGDSRIAFAYLFGSEATGTAGPRSDVDVVAWFREPVPEDAQLDLMGLVTAAVRIDSVDVVVLNSAPLTLAAEVLKGTLLVSTDEDLRVEVESGIMSRWHDRVHYIRRGTEEAGRRLSERGWS